MPQEVDHIVLVKQGQYIIYKNTFIFLNLHTITMLSDINAIYIYIYT